MFFGFILIRILFVACMVFIIGHVFGSFSQRLVLRRITRVAAILAVVLFFLSNAFMMRAAWGIHPGDTHRPGTHERGWCGLDYNDSTASHSGFSEELQRR
jgi:low affinity Fe/Cu permease